LPDNFLIQSKIIREAVEESFDILGRPGKGILLDVLKERGIDLDDTDSNYSLDIIKQMIGKVFDAYTADLILIRVKQVLKKYGTDTFTGPILQRDGLEEISDSLDDKTLVDTSIGEVLTDREQDKSVHALTLTSKQVNYLYSAVSNMIADTENLDDALVKFGGRGEYYIRELQQNLPVLQKLLLEMSKK
jgi:hypothetical protein